MLAAAELGGKQPQLGPLDRCVPEDQYYVVFRSLTKLLDAANAGNLWGSHLFSQAAKYAKSQRTSERLKAQLAIQTEPLLRPFYDTFVNEVAVTGGDLFFREGSDMDDVFFRVKQPELFRRRSTASSTRPRSRARRRAEHGRMGTVNYESVTTPDRAIHVFSAYPRSDLHVRSNSKPALERMLAAVAGGRQVPSLGAGRVPLHPHAPAPRRQGRRRAHLPLRSVDPPAGRPGLEVDRAAAADLLQPPADDRPRGHALPHAVRQAGGLAGRVGGGRLRPGAGRKTPALAAANIRWPTTAQRVSVPATATPWNWSPAGSSPWKRSRPPRPSSTSFSWTTIANTGGSISIPSPSASRLRQLIIAPKRSSFP